MQGAPLASLFKGRFRLNRLAFAVAAASALAGCGAGTSTTSTSQTRTLGGFAIDGYLADAEVRCLDASGKTVASSRTTSSGAWILRTRSSAASCQTLEVYDGVDVGTNSLNASERSPLPLGTRFTATIAHLNTSTLGNTALIVSPLTTLIHATQTQTGQSAAAARSTVLLALGVSDALDPLLFNPITNRNPGVFSAGAMTAAVIRETSSAILEAVAGIGQPVSLDLRRQVYQRVTDSLAALIVSGAVTRNSLTAGQPAPDGPLAGIALGALARLRADAPAFSAPVAAVQQAGNVATIAAQYAGRAASQVIGVADSADLSVIAQRAASLSNSSQSDVQRPLILAALANEPGLDLPALAGTVRAAIANPPTILTIAKTNGQTQSIELVTTLKDYLQVAGEQLRFYTTGDLAVGRTVTVNDFELGTAPTLPGALSAVALSFTQPGNSTLLTPAAEITAQLGFRVERVDPTGIMSIRLAAIVDGVKLSWSDNGLVVRTPGESVLYGAVRIGSTADDTPLTLTNTNNRLATLVSTDKGLLRIDMAALLTALGLNADSVLQTYLSDSALVVEAVISNVVLARSQNATVRKLGALSVSVERGAGQAALSASGAGLRGTVTAGR
jgi:hypothetical protein